MARRVVALRCALVKMDDVRVPTHEELEMRAQEDRDTIDRAQRREIVDGVNAFVQAVHAASDEGLFAIECAIFVLYLIAV